MPVQPNQLEGTAELDGLTSTVDHSFSNAALRPDLPICQHLDQQIMIKAPSLANKRPFIPTVVLPTHLQTQTSHNHPKRSALCQHTQPSNESSKKTAKPLALSVLKEGIKPTQMSFKWSAILLTAFAGFLVSTSKPAGCQITESPKYYHKWLDCAVTGGLSGFSRPCGIMEHYSYIFIGSVISVTQISEEEERLQLQPQHIFLGEPVDQLTVTTSQGNCLQQIQSGDEWLFYLSRDDTTKELLLSYGSPSGPVADKKSTIALLRRLSHMTDSGVIMGYVHDTFLHDDDNGVTWTEYINIPYHQILAKRLSDGIEYSVFSNSDSHYEFQSLPSGKYHITPNTTPGLWAEDGDTDVSPGSCTQINFALSTDGRISGHVTPADGKPFEATPWVEVQSDDVHFSKSTPVDDQGYYELRGLPAGRYLVGIGITSQSATSEWRSRVYYPGVHTKELAATVDLGKAEVRSDIDFAFAQPAIKQNKDKTTDDTTPDQKAEQ